MNLLEPHPNRIITHTSGIRNRQITNWKFIPDIDGSYIAGITLSEDGVTLDFLRTTTTSIVKCREGRIMITSSGSRYELMDPAPGVDPNSYLTIPEKI